MAFAQALLHVLIFLSRNPLHLKESFQFYGFLVSYTLLATQIALTTKQADLAFGTIVLLTWIRHPFYEFFLKSHSLLALLILFALWRYLTVRSTFSHVYLIIGASILAATTVMRYAGVLFRPFSQSQPYALSRVVRVHDANDAICLQVDIPRYYRYIPCRLG